METNKVEDTSELLVADFDELEAPDADVVSLGSAAYAKMNGKVYS